MKKMNYPADYAVLSNEEMTYTAGGGAIDNAASIATTDALAADMSKSASNFVRDAVSATMVVALAPLSAVLLIVR